MDAILDTTPSNSAQGLCGAPDAPPCYKSVSLHVTEDGGMGFLSKEPTICLDNVKRELRQQSSSNAVVLTLDFQVTDNTRVKWETVVFKNKMYAQVPNGILPEGSKEAFVSLLEFAEDELDCECIVVCFSKSRVDRAHLIRTFMFLGFTTLPPGHDLIPSGSSDDTLFMAYTTM